MINAATRRRVRNRAADRCEYCALRQEQDPLYRFHIEHEIPRQHGGVDDLTNLALACHHCNLHKGPNLAGIDPDSGQLTPLYNPRLQMWDEHFFLDGDWMVGKTAIGRATIVVLAMNDAHVRELRALLP